MKPAIFLHCKELSKNHYPESCPFNTSRAELTRRVLHSMGMLFGSEGIEREPQPASSAALETFHTPAYLEALRQASLGHLDETSLHMGLGTPDTPIFHGLYEHAVLASGATLTGARLILEGQTDTVFNPSGGFHHAHAQRAGGFCYINDVVLAAEQLAKAGRKVLILDVDAHHCDGVQSAFWERNDVMTISLHEGPLTLFPGTGFESEIGEGPGAGYSVNVPFPPGVFDEPYLQAFREIALPLVPAFNPDVIMLELGLDGLNGDPLTHMSLTNNAYVEVVKAVMSFNKPVLAVGGGGYNVMNTARGWALLWSILSGAGSDDEMLLGLGGVMLESTEWKAGLRDRAIAIPSSYQVEMKRLVNDLIERVKHYVFPLHGL